MYFITTKRMLEVCFSVHPNIQYRTFVCLHGGRAGRKAGLRFLVPGGWSANSKRGWKQGTVSTTGKS